MISAVTGSNSPPTYPYPELLGLLPSSWTPATYQQMTNGLFDYELWKDPAQNADYWAALPRIIFASCPFCDQPFVSPANPMSLAGWAIAYLSIKKKFYPAPEAVQRSPWCPHYLGIHQFINLHNTIPNEIEDLSNPAAEVPYLSPGFFRDGFITYAVLHVQPICRVENDQFVPRYTVFSITYFANDPDGLLRLPRPALSAPESLDSGFYINPICPPPGIAMNTAMNEELYDLPHWAISGQLGWVDWLAPHRLWLRPNLQLPAMYQAIAGRRTPYNWRNGRFRDRY